MSSTAILSRNFSITKSAPAWSTVCFRRATSGKGWALLGVPEGVAPVVLIRLVLNRARLLSDLWMSNGLVILHFECPVEFAAKLSLLFPAPPEVEPLVISAGGNRILTGAAAQSPQARRQATKSEARQRALAG